MTVELAQQANHDLIGLWNSLKESGAITDTELRLPPDISYSSYEALAMMLGRVKRSTSWLIGDLILYGETVYGEKYAQAITLTGLAEQTCANYASICKNIPPSRRRVGISFSLHQEVAYLEPQQQNEWLDKAEQQEWTKAKLRYELQAAGLVGDFKDSGLMSDLANRARGDEVRHEPHPEEHLEKIHLPAVSVEDFLGDPELGPNIEPIAARIVVALSCASDEERNFVVNFIHPGVREHVRSLIADDFY